MPQGSFLLCLFLNITHMHIYLHTHTRTTTATCILFFIFIFPNTAPRASSDGWLNPSATVAIKTQGQGEYVLYI